MRCAIVSLTAAAAIVAACEGAPLTPKESGGIADAGAEAAADAGVDSGVDAGDPVYPFPVPRGFPRPRVPRTNPLTREKVELGRHLFYDVRLSGNQTQSCASCHEQAHAFSDTKARAVGSTGQEHPRSSMSLANVAYATTLTWANPVLTTLEQQASVPMLGIDPIVELGLRGLEDEALGRLRAEPRYASLFSAAFPADPDPFTMPNVLRAIASFERTLLSGNSRFDRFRYGGDESALTAQEKRGLELFGSETLECFHCHGSFDFTDAVTHDAIPAGGGDFHNTGLYNVDGKGGFPPPNRGLIDFTGEPSDMGRFKAPTLRNVAVTAPYMHDGSVATLEDALEHYAAGGRTITSGPNAGNGSANPFKSGFIVSFTIPAEDKAALVAFLRSLTDEEFLTSAAFANPW